jgi:hypothetical protein
VDSASGEDARRWYQTYQDLLRFKLEAIAAVLQHDEALDAAGHAEVELDLLVLEAERERLEQRAEYWRRQCDVDSGDG